MTAPVFGAYVGGRSVSLTATASDNVGVTGVQFLLDGTTNIGSRDTSAPYSRNWNTTSVSNGPHTLGARASDAAGNTAVDAVSVIVDNQPPAGTVVISGGAAVTNTRSVTLTLAASDALGPVAQMRFSNSGTSFSGTRAYATTTTWTLSSGAGTKTVYVQFRDVAGNWSSATSSDTIVLDTTAPVISGVASSGISDSAATITWSTDEPSTSQVEYGPTTSYGSLSPLDTALVTGHSVRVTGLSPETTYNYRVRSRDAAGNERTGSSLTFTTTTGPVDQTPPQVAVTAPSPGAQVGGVVPVAASATDNVGVAGVQFLVDGAAIGAEDTTAPYALSWDTRSVGNGSHTVSARARDAAGNLATSATVTVSVSNPSQQFQNEILITGLDLPTTIEFLPDGRMLIAELLGTIHVASFPYTSVNPMPFGTITNIGTPAQQGIMDIVLDPDFVNNHYYYVFYTAGNPNRDRLSRFTANASLTGTVAGSELILYQDGADADAEHHGGALNFGNDGKLYFTTGDHFIPSTSPLLSSPRGKIHRINPDGTAPTDNPFYDGAGPNVDTIWARGLRNPFRAYYDKPTGRLYVGDVGGNVASTSIEELNVGAAGADYGWPSSEGPCALPCTSPLYSYPHAGRDAAIVAGFVYHGSQYPSAYQGSLFFADYGQNWIRRLTFDANGNVSAVLNFEPADGSVDGPYGDIVFLTEGPDGALYYIDLGWDDQGGPIGISRIRRIRYVQQNLAPVAVAVANPTSGPVPLSVSFSSAGSLDPEGQPLTYAWTFGDGGTATEANPIHVYSSAGSYEVRLEVSDGVNTTEALPIVVVVGGAPVPTITAPTDGSRFRAGDVITFAGSAVDPEDGALPATAFAWSIDFLHEGHVHPGPRYTGVTGGSFTIPTSGHDFSGNTRYRVLLTVTDSNGIQTSKSVTVLPDKVNLTFATEPTGRTVYVDGIAHTAPFVYDTLVGFTHTVEARNQGNYSFESWSDGGAQSHEITVPTADRTYTAVFAQTTTLPPGAVGEWSLDDGAGTSALDSTGNGHVGTLVGGPSWIAGHVGGALQFDGSNDYVDIALESAFDFTGAFSVSFWMRRNGFANSWEALVTKGDSSWGVGRNNNGHSIAFTTFNASGTSQDLFGTTVVDNDQWHHVVVVYTGSQKQLYIDGALNASANYTQVIRTNNLNVRMGMNQEFPSAMFGGALDEVRIYGRALTPAEVALLFSQ
jgi:glucose/arabinose dehydrogenase